MVTVAAGAASGVVCLVVPQSYRPGNGGAVEMVWEVGSYIITRSPRIVPPVVHLKQLKA